MLNAWGQFNSDELHVSSITEGSHHVSAVLHVCNLESISASRAPTHLPCSAKVPGTLSVDLLLTAFDTDLYTTLHLIYFMSISRTRL